MISTSLNLRSTKWFPASPSQWLMTLRIQMLTGGDSFRPTTSWKTWLSGNYFNTREREESGYMCEIGRQTNKQSFSSQWFTNLYICALTVHQSTIRVWVIYSLPCTRSLVWRSWNLSSDSWQWMERPESWISFRWNPVWVHFSENSVHFFSYEYT